MNTKMIEANWTELKGKIQSKWGKFNDDEIETFKGDLNQLAGKIQKAYGIAKDQADLQFDEFKKTVQTLIGHETDTVKAGPKVTASLTVELPKPNTAKVN